MSKENPTRRDFNKLGLASILSPSLLVACTSKPKPLPPTQQVPSYNTNLTSVKSGAFGDSDFDVRQNAVDLDIGNYLFARLGKSDVIEVNDLQYQGEQIFNHVALRTDLMVEDIDPETGRASYGFADGTWYAFLKHNPKPGHEVVITTNKTGKRRERSLQGRDVLLRESKFSAEYFVLENDDKRVYFAENEATPQDDILLMPNAEIRLNHERGERGIAVLQYLPTDGQLYSQVKAKVLTKDGDIFVGKDITKEDIVSGRIEETLIN